MAEELDVEQTKIWVEEIRKNNEYHLEKFAGKDGNHAAKKHY